MYNLEKPQTLGLNQCSMLAIYQGLINGKQAFSCSVN